MLIYCIIITANNDFQIGNRRYLTSEGAYMKQKKTKVQKRITWVPIVKRMILLSAFIALFIGIISYARGYRFDPKQKSISSTGIIAATSNPKAAKIYINGELKGVTDMSLTLPPGKYTVEIKKDGFMDWKKEFTLKGELVMIADAMLFPVNASLTPLTNLGVGKIVPIDDTGKSLLFVQNGNFEKDGIYIFDQSKKPFSLFPPLKTLVLRKYLPETIDLLSCKVTFSPDYKEGIFEFMDEDIPIVAYDMGFEEEVEIPFDVTSSTTSLIQAWDEERRLEAIKILEALPKDLRPVASDSFKIISFSPDKTKLLYTARKNGELPLIMDPPLISANQEQEERTMTAGGIYVYDMKEDKNFRVKMDLPENVVDIAHLVMWYPDSRHLVVNEEDKVSVMEYDNTNRQTVYSGPHEQNFVDITSDGKLLILANLNPQSNKAPDVYSVGIR